MKKIILGVPALLLSFLAVGSWAWADDTVSVNVMGGANLNGLLLLGNHAYEVDPGFGFDVGGSVGLMVSQRWEVELGAAYLSRSLNMNAGTTTYTEHFLEVPLSMRYYISEAFSVNGGLYAAFGLGDVTSTVSGVSQSLSYSAANLDDFELGILLGVRFQHYISESIALFLEGRYEAGYQRVQSVSNTRINYGLHALAGMQLGF